jgi:hypothetical protein
MGKPVSAGCVTLPIALRTQHKPGFEPGRRELEMHQLGKTVLIKRLVRRNSQGSFSDPSRVTRLRSKRCPATFFSLVRRRADADLGRLGDLVQPLAGRIKQE